jgi:hypothetical protein
MRKTANPEDTLNFEREGVWVGLVVVWAGGAVVSLLVSLSLHVSLSL